jgi:galactose-1-phosphate uridylyltransferase
MKLQLSAWRRKRVQRKFGTLFQDASIILFRHDPIGISAENNTDEYDCEVGTILPRMSRCASAIAVRRVVFEEFQRWFTPEVAGDEMRYDLIANELWELWQTSRRTSR